MNDLSREMWRRDYMRMMDDEYDDYGFWNDSDADDYGFEDETQLFSDEEGSPDEGYWHSNTLAELDAIQKGTLVLSEDDLESLIHGIETDEAVIASGLSWMEYEDEPDESEDAPEGILKLRDIEMPDKEESGIKKLKRDIRMEALRRLETSARTTSDFINLVSWYDELDANSARRWRYHELSRGGDELPLEYGEAEEGAIFPYSMSDIISRQMRKGDFLDAIYCKPDTIHELVTTDYIIRFLRALGKNEKDLFYFKVLESLSTTEISEMRDTSDRYIRKIWQELMFHIRQKTMGVLIFRSDLDYSLTGQELNFLATCRDEYEFRIESEVYR